MTDETVGFAVVPVVIQEYRHHEPLPGLDAEAVAVTAAFAELGGVTEPWPVPPAERTATNTSQRLMAWASPVKARSSVLMWMGHGHADLEGNAWLALHETPNPISRSGLNPQTMADHILAEWSRRSAAGAGEPWTVVVVEACGAAAFVRKLAAILLDQAGCPERLILIGVGGEGATHVGDFNRALRAALKSYTDNDEVIQLKDLVRQLEDRISDGEVFVLGMPRAAVLHRRRRLPSPVTATVDVYEELQEFLAGLSDDERGHFVPKAQGAEHGELAWYFTGRAAEQERIASWLRETTTGMFIVTGRAGAGKSALLGHMLVSASPGLRELLTRAGQLKSLPDSARAPDGVFDAVVHLTGVTTADLLARLAEAAEIATPDDSTGRDIDWLLLELHRRSRPFTVLVDALDEAQDPIGVADSVLRKIASIRHCRVVVGTRASTQEGADRPEPQDKDLIEALDRSTDTPVMVVERDPAAISEYVRKRLETGKELDLDEVALRRVVELIGKQDRHFLFARLAVHEIIARPQLLEPRYQDELISLLSQDHRALFAAAVDRLTARSPMAWPLLEALALSRGRGLPRVQQVWHLVTGALAGGVQVSEVDIDDLLCAAAPYIMLDAEDGQSTFRLAQRTFQEYFDSVAHTPAAARHRLIASALIGTARAGLPLAPNPYVVRHLAEHVAEAGRWAELVAEPDVLDQLDPDEVAAEVLRTSFGRVDLPSELIGVITARHALAATPPKERSAVRKLAAARFIGTPPAFQRTSGGVWDFRWSHVARTPPHVVLGEHSGEVYGVVQIRLADGSVLLASAGDDHFVRLWDPVTGRLVGDPLPVHLDRVRGLVPMEVGQGRTVLAVTDFRHTELLWDSATRKAIHDRQHARERKLIETSELRASVDWQLSQTRGALPDLAGHRLVRLIAGMIGPVNSLSPVSLPDGRRLVVTGSPDGKVRLWAPVNNHAQTSNQAVNLMTSLSVQTGATLLITSGFAGRPNLWNCADGRPHWLASLPTGQISAIAAVSVSPNRTLVATSDMGRDMVRLWDPMTGEAVRFLAPAGPAYRGGAQTLAVLPLRPGHDLLATSLGGGRVRVWDPQTGKLVREWNTSTRDAPNVMAVVRPAHRFLLALTESYTGAVELWDCQTAKTACRLHAVADGTMNDLASVRRSNGEVLIATGGQNGMIRLWNPLDGTETGGPLKGHTGEVRALAELPRHGMGSLLASAGFDNTIRLWDPDTGAQLHCLPLLDIQPRSLTAIGRDLAIGTDRGVIMLRLN